MVFTDNKIGTIKLFTFMITQAIKEKNDPIQTIFLCSPVIEFKNSRRVLGTIPAQHENKVNLCKLLQF